MKKLIQVKRVKQKPKIAVDADSTFLIAKISKKNAKLRSVVDFTNSPAAEDKVVYTMANKANYHVLTGNISDFFKFPKSKKDVGVIGHRNPIDSKSTQKELADFLKKVSHEDLFGKCIVVDHQGIKVIKNFS